MRVRLAVLLVVLLGATLSPLPAMAEEPLRVMPLGDSITEGANGDATYRYFLWHDLLNAGYAVDFVGSMHGVKGRRAQPLYPDFDQDHEGHSGWTSKKIGNYANLFAQQADPDVVLLHAGTNDLLRGVAPSRVKRNLQRIVEQLRLANPVVVVYVAQIIPIRGLEAQVNELNGAIAALATEMNTAASPVIAVDQNTGFNVNADLKADGIHPTESGFVKMAQRWFAAIDA
jgi:lysophospholipase L1-like esterase